MHSGLRRFSATPVYAMKQPDSAIGGKGTGTTWSGASSTG